MTFPDQLKIARAEGELQGALLVLLCDARLALQRLPEESNIYSWLRASIETTQAKYDALAALNRGEAA